MHAPVPPSDAALELFTQGHAPARRKTSYLSYVRHKGGGVALDVDTMKNPVTFLHALRDFVDVRKRCNFLFEGLGNMRAAAWEHHMIKTRSVLHQQFEGHGCTRNGETEHGVVLGTAAEYVMSETIKEFARVLNASGGDVHMPEWQDDDSGIEHGIRLGMRHRLRSRFPHHALLDEKDSDWNWVPFREIDMLLLMANDTFFSLDVTCSEKKMRRVRENFMLEADMVRFASSMRELHKESDGKEGFKHVAQMHIQCVRTQDARENTFSTICENHTPGQGVYALKLPLLAHILEVTKKTEELLHTDARPR